MGLKSNFKTTYKAVRIKIQLELTRVFCASKRRKKSNSIQARGGSMFGRAYNPWGI